MEPYLRRVQYHETDRMGIAHHSNYVRWMEEARMELLRQMGWPMSRLEAEGITSPVVSVECKYLRPTTYDDRISILVTVEQYTGVKLRLSYTMTNETTGETVLTASSSHCFIDENSRPISLKKRFPAFDETLREYITP